MSYIIEVYNEYGGASRLMRQPKEPNVHTFYVAIRNSYASVSHYISWCYS